MFIDLTITVAKRVNSDHITQTLLYMLCCITILESIEFCHLHGLASLIYYIVPPIRRDVIGEVPEGIAT